MQKPIRPKDPYNDQPKPYSDYPDIIPAFVDEYRKVDADYVDRVVTLLNEGHPDDLSKVVTAMRADGDAEHRILEVLLTSMTDWYCYGN